MPLTQPKTNVFLAIIVLQSIQFHSMGLSVHGLIKMPLRKHPSSRQPAHATNQLPANPNPTPIPMTGTLIPMRVAAPPTIAPTPVSIEMSFAHLQALE